MIGARSTKHKPSRSSDALAIWIARRVLPTPPVPHSVTSRFCANSARTSAYLRTAAHKCGELRRENRCRAGFGRAQWGKLFANVGVAQLHDPFGTR
ncbi:Uncharacterised protein [Mycobacterium tuberculosis]|nr:Uncharacterised protein [Mycobacterium tuberculosis]